MNINTLRPDFLLWDVTNRNHWQIAARGTYEECQAALIAFGDGYEIHANEIKDTWNNVVTGMHFDTFMDDTSDMRPMTSEEIASEA